jgi:hypothetical protein
MSWNIKIYNPSTATTTDITNQVIEIQANEKLDAESNSISLTCKDIMSVQKFKEITISKNGVKRFAGTIMNQSDEDKGFKVTSLICVDWSFIFTHRTIAEDYQKDDALQGKPKLILQDMLSKGAGEITTINMGAPSTIIDELEFPYKQLMESIQKVMDYVPDWHWYVDPDKDFHLFKKYEKDGVTFGADKNGQYNFRIDSLKVDYLGEQQANRVWIIGAKIAKPNYIDVYHTGDGKQRYFDLPYEPNYTEIYLDGVLKNSKIEKNDDGLQDFLINKKEKVFYIPDYVTTPFTGEIRVHFRPTGQVIDYFENPSHIDDYGLYEKVVKNKDITDKLSARQYGKAMIKRKSTDKRLVSLSTTEDVKVGERCPIDINYSHPEKGTWNIQGDFVVISVSTNITAKHEVRSVQLEEIII